MSIDLTKDVYPAIIGQCVYKLNDPTADSIYKHYNKLEWTDERITEELNKPLIWQTDSRGYIKIEYPLDSNFIKIQEYLPEQLPNLLSFYGAIYTYFNQDLTEEDSVKYHLIFNRITGQIRTGIIKRRQVFYTVLFRSIDNRYIRFANQAYKGVYRLELTN